MRTMAMVAMAWLAGAGAGAAEPGALTARLQAGQAQTLVTYGTSLTAGGAWVGQLQKALEAQFPGRARIINSGQGGMWSGWGVSNLEARVIRKKPDAVLIEFAINDAFLQYQTSPAVARGNLEAMIDRIEKALPQCEVILMTMNPPTGVHLERRPQFEAYYQFYREVAQARKLRLIDHEPNWTALLQKEPARFKELVPDGIHPNAAGCEKIILPQLLKSLGLAAAGP
jgi:acyl-CoA thioesterase I